MSLLSRKGPKAGENSGIWTPFLWKNRPIFTHTERKERKLNSSQKRKKRAILTRPVEETIIYPFKKSPWVLNGNSTAIAKPKVADTFVIRVREYQAEDFFIIFLLPKQSPTIFSGRYFPEAYGHTNASLTSLVCNPIYSNHLSTSIYTHYIVQLEGSTYKKVKWSTGRSLRVSQEGARSHQFFEKRKQQSKFAIVVPRGVLRPLLLSGLYLTVS